MAGFLNVRKAFHRTTSDGPQAPIPMGKVEQIQDKKQSTITDGPIASSSGSNEDELDNEPSTHAQRGVQEVEAATLTWGKWTLIWVFFNMWLLYFVNSMQSNVLSSLMPFITSDFSAHSLLNTVDVVAGAMSSAVYIPLAKLMDVWGRAEGFMFMTVLSTLSLVMMAGCNNLYTYCAANVFYNVGFSGLTFCVDVITADSSHLKNRGLAYAFTSSPYMITAFAGSAAAQAFYDNVGWRWGIGAWAIIFPVVAFPLFFVLKDNARKAKKSGKLIHVPSGRTFLQNVWFHLIDFDVVGLVLFSCGLTVFLLPFTIASAAPDGWSSGYIIAMIVVGFVVLVLWGLWEAYLAPVPMLSYKLLTDRTIIAACTLDFFYDMSYYTWNTYFTSFLMVVNNVSQAEAGYISNAFEIVSGLLLFVVGYLMRHTGRMKWLLYFSIPFYILTMGLMIYFRKPNQNVGFLVMCQVFLSISGCVFELTTQVGVEAAVDHQHVAGALGLLNEVGTVGYSIGAAIGGAIWTNTFEKALEMYLPESALSNLADIYEDLDTQLSYAPGTATRTAIQEAYGYAQTRMLAAATGLFAITLICLVLYKDLDLRKLRQAKGMIF